MPATKMKFKIVPCHYQDCTQYKLYRWNLFYWSYIGFYNFRSDAEWRAKHIMATDGITYISKGQPPIQ